MAGAQIVGQHHERHTCSTETLLTTQSIPPWDLIAEWIPHVVWVTDAKGSTEYFNRRGHDLVGLTPEETSGWGWLRVVHPDDAAGARDAWQRAIRDGTPYEVEYRVRTAGGDYRWMVARALPVRGIDGQVIQWAGTWTDVDDLKRLHDLLGGPGGAAASLAILEALQSTAPVGIGFVDREFHIVHMNELLAGLNGLSSDEAQGRSLPEVMGSIWPRFEPLYRQVIETGKAIANVGTARTNAEGLPSHWLNSYFPVRVDTEVVGVGVVGIDVTDRKREAELQAHDAELHSVVMKNMAEGLYALDAQGLVTYLNAAAAKMLGWAPEELLGKPMHETVHFQQEDGTPVPASECPLLKVRTLGQTIRVDRRCLHPQGRLHLPRLLLVGSATQRNDRRRRRRGLPRHHRRTTTNSAASSATSPRSAGWDGSATPSTKTGWFCTPNPSSPPAAARPAKNSSCA